MKVEIEVTDDNTFNLGWLLYVLGQDQPNADSDPMGHDGWAMGRQTGGMLTQVRNVFARQPMLDQPQYIIRAPKVTNVGPDQQADAKALAREHAKDVAKGATDAS